MAHSTCPYPEISHQVTYRYIGGKADDGILSCGFMRKPSTERSQYDFSIPYYSCVLLLSGKGEYWDEQGKRYVLEPGCVIQRLPHRIHSTYVEGDGQWLEFYISFGKGTYDYLRELGLLSEDRPVLFYPEPGRELSRCKKLLTQMEEASDGALGSSLLAAQRLVLTLTGGDQMKKEWSPSVESACRMLERDLGRALSLEKIAEELCMGYETFRKLFCRETGMSPDGYRQQKRMTTARMMLLEGQSVTAVSKALGYSDAYAFSKQFKRFCGYAPSVYAKGENTL